MSKISSQQYAQGLLAASQGMSPEKINQLIRNLLKIVVKNNDLAKTEKILFALQNLIKKEKGILPVEIISSFPLGRRINIFQKAIEKKLGKKIEITEKVDSSLLGGMILKFEDFLIDASVRKKLENLKQKILTS